MSVRSALAATAENVVVPLLVHGVLVVAGAADTGPAHLADTHRR